MREIKPQAEEFVCDECLEPFPETQMVPVDDMLVCRACWRALRRSDGRDETWRRK
jgi:formylmethanofuran dehydrogenase subunit E